MPDQKITVTCSVKDTLPLRALAEFHPYLKQRVHSDLQTVMSSIYRYGIAFPFFVWKHGEVNYILDGNGRFAALRRAMFDGVTVPDLPVVYIEADDETQAEQLLLRLNSRYGVITPEGLQDFIGDVEINLDDVRLPDIPDLSAVINYMVTPAGTSYDDEEEEPRKLVVYCPECGEVHEFTDDELREALGDGSSNPVSE